MDGQMSIFDFPEFLPGEKHTRFIRKNEYESWHCDNCGFKHPLIRLVGDWPYHKQILTEKCPNCNAIVDIPEDIRKENELYNSEVEKTIKRHTCKHSGHLCNKEELWKVASESDPFCPRVCCRFCATKMCGARCNGSEEPKTKEVKTPCMRECDVEWCSIACFEKRGRIYDKVHREWCKDSEGKPLIRDTKECDWNPKAVPVNIKGICDDGYCPSCGASLDDLIEKCPDCGTLLDWTHWKIINDMED